MNYSISKAQEKKHLLALLMALDVSQDNLRLDDCDDWHIVSPITDDIGCNHARVKSTGDCWAIYVPCRSKRHWSAVKRKLNFMTITADGDDEGALELDRLPSSAEAAVIRKILRFHKRHQFRPETLAKLRSNLVQNDLAAQFEGGFAAWH
jgi:hypothetical protein